MTRYLFTSGDGNALKASTNDRRFAVIDMTSIKMVQDLDQQLGRTQRDIVWHQCRKLETWLWNRYRFCVPIERRFHVYNGSKTHLI